jgi:ABC-type transport system involved in multi-copper enzyme maturation permease subunit
MGIDVAHYHGWQGRLHSPWYASLAMVRIALLQVFRRKSYWIVLFLGFAQFLVYWSIIYAVTQMRWPLDVRQQALQQFGFSAQVGAAQESGYIQFMDRQNIVVMILLAFSGSLLVGSDFRQKSLPFYLSRRIDRRHYIAGKLLAVSSLITIITIVPALLLFVEFGSFTASLDYWINNRHVPLAILAYGAVLCVVNSILLVTMSAYLQRLAPIAIAWSSLFVMLGRLSKYLHESSQAAAWQLLDPWRDMRMVGRLCFGTFDSAADRTLAWWALLVLVAVCALSLALLARRVRAVDVVE